MSNPLSAARQNIEAHFNDLKRYPIGEKQRALNRKTHLLNVHKKALQIIEEHMPKMFHPIPNASGFDSKWAKINADLLKDLPNYADYHRANNFIAAILQQGNNQGAWTVKLPPSLISIKRDRPLRTKKWFTQAKTIAQFHQHWLKAIDSGVYDIGQPINLYIAIVLSAVFYCGANHQATLMAFIKAIAARQKLVNIGDYYYLELTVEDQHLNTNTFDDVGEPITIQRLFLSLPTCALIKQWYKTEHTNWQHPASTFELKTLLNNHLKAFELKIRSLALFCKAAIIINENLPNANIPQALIEYTTARNQSYSLPAHDWLAIWGRQITQLAPMAFSDFKTIPSIKASKQKLKNHKPSHHHLIDILNKALRTNVNGIKR